MILNADARAVPLADGSVHCVVTSPPYWGLRDYGTARWVGGAPECAHRQAATGGSQNKGNNNREGAPFKDRCGLCGAERVDDQLGLEPTPEEYVATMVAVFREVWRVLRDDGTCWLNLGDSYVSNASGAKPQTGFPVNRRLAREAIWLSNANGGPGLKAKDMVGIPWRVAFALQADGWYLRSDVIWSKPNPMPESVTDRPTKAHEYLFLLAKRERYYYDAEAIKEPAEYREPNSPQSIKSPYDQGFTRRGKALTSPRMDGNSWNENNGRGFIPAALGRNRRSVWEIATQPYPEAHFATFPEALVEPCVLAGTSEYGCCGRCGAPWERMVERSGGTIGEAWHDHNQDLVRGQRNSPQTSDGTYKVVTTGWQPTCDCGPGPPTPPLVLDPFAGSGTVGLVCHRLGRRFVGTELKPEYCRMAYARTAQLGLV